MSGCLPFTHALIAALQLIVAGLGLTTASHKEQQGLVRLHSLLACTDRCIAGDHSRFQATPLHVLKEFQGLVRLLPVSHALIAAL